MGESDKLWKISQIKTLTSLQLIFFLYLSVDIYLFEPNNLLRRKNLLQVSTENPTKVENEVN